MISSIPKWIGGLFEGALSPNVKILQTTYISPQIKKIRFQGNKSQTTIQIGYASVVRVSDTEFRNYTVSYHDSKSGILDIIFHIHGNGVGSQLIDRLCIHDELYIGPSRGKKMYNPKVNKQFIFGDETSLGFACSILPSLKQNNHQFQFYFQLNEENNDAPRLLGLEHYATFPKKGSFNNEGWIRKLPVFNTTDWQQANFILTGNAKSVQTFRKVLKEKKIGNILSQGYWLEGKKGL
jgi:NADPH-dependent ferric siderophore reductase